MQRRAAEVCLVELRASEIGSGERGASEVRLLEVGMGEICIGEIRTAQVRCDEIGRFHGCLSELCTMELGVRCMDLAEVRLRKDGAGSPGADQHRSIESGISEIRLVQDGLIENRHPKIARLYLRLDQLRSFQIGLLQISLLQTGRAEVRVSQVCPAEDGLTQC